MRSVGAPIIRAFQSIRSEKRANFGRKRSKLVSGSVVGHITRRPRLIGAPEIFIGVSAMDRRDYTVRSEKSDEKDENNVAFINPDFCDLLEFASNHGPGFPIDPDSVEILKDPSDFYDSLVVRKSSF